MNGMSNSISRLLKEMSEIQKEFEIIWITDISNKMLKNYLNKGYSILLIKKR